MVAGGKRERNGGRALREVLQVLFAVKGFQCV